jgi:hypothetical protein
MKKDLLALAFIVLVIGVLVSGVKIQSVDEYYRTHPDKITPDSETVSLSIECTSVLTNNDKLDKSLEEYIPVDGIILPETEYVLNDGDTVFDILDKAVRYNKIQIEYQNAELNNFGSVYIQGINYLYEFSCGSFSGWRFKVNGEYADCGSNQYVQNDGDKIEWVYTCSLDEQH